jgi:radical SAM superfamily enzyme YgiQ (UPF0313 family)
LRRSAALGAAESRKNAGVTVLLVSTYELGHQPLALASPAAALRRAGHDVRCLDLSVEMWDPELVAWADKVAFSVPMHTATRMAVEAGGRIPGGKDVTFSGLSAGLVGGLAGEYEPALLEWAGGGDGVAVGLGRHRFDVPARDLLPPLDRYARLALPGGEERLAGSVEASHGCVHRCRHCPVPVVYDGRIRIVADDVVLADIAQLVDLGARHITFGDPDFLNGPHHSLRVVRAMHAAFPDLTFDCTVKVEHILRHADLWPELAAAGCLFVVSALEHVNDDILRRLDKGHTAAEAAAAVELLRAQGIHLRPSLLPFTPWTTRDDLVALLDFVAAHDLIGNVDPVQYAIRLLLPEGSLLLAHPDMAPHLGAYEPDRFTWTWTHPDPAIDDLQGELAALAEAGGSFDDMAAAVGSPAPAGGPVPERPRLTEAWFCCAEPTELQLEAAGAVNRSRPAPGCSP